MTNPCQNQGFILDDYPENYYQAKALFMSEDSQYDEEPGEDGKDVLDSRLSPGMHAIQIHLLIYSNNLP